MIRPDWIAVDWGTTHLRVFAMGNPARASGIIAEAVSDDGMGRLARQDFEPALLRLIGGWLDPGRVTPVIACGMVGSRQGWFEAPYRTVPCTALDGGGLARVPVADPRLSVRIVPGLNQISPADVMRGEETQIAGALALTPGFDGVICLPGTHSKWVHVSAAEVVSFQTFMTGELFALLSEQSVLRHSMATEGWDDAGFDAALSDTLSRPERIGARLFGLRAEGLIAGLSPVAARSRLSGMLIGLELAGARAYWLGQPVLIVGASRLSAIYARALSAQGVSVRQLAANETVLAGLSAARRSAHEARP
jgi:2-dehydro-3-deoxygalactonokinase